MVDQEATKVFMDTDSTIDFSDPNTAHDRVLFVEGQKFYVNSGHLSLFSEFFHGLFDSHFIEHDMKEIELNDIAATDFDNFLHALYPLSFAVTEANLPGLMQLSSRFLSKFVWSRCMLYLQDDENFAKFALEDLLEWSKGSGSVEFKARVETAFMKSKVYVNIDREKAERWISRVQLKPEYELFTREEIIDELLYSNVNYIDKFFDIAVDYDLEFKNKVECIFIENLRLAPYKMKHLNLSLEDKFLDSLPELKKVLREKLQMSIKKFGKKDSNGLVEAIFSEPSNEIPQSNAQLMICDIFSEEDDQDNAAYRYLEIANTYDMVIVRAYVEDHIENHMRFLLSADKIATVFEKAKKPASLAHTAETALMSLFGKEKSPNLLKYLDIMSDNSMNALKDVIEKYLMDVANSRNLCNLVDLLDMAYIYNLERLAVYIDDWLVNTFKLNSTDLELRNETLYYCIEATQYCYLPGTMVELENLINFMLNKPSETSGTMYEELFLINIEDTLLPETTSPVTEFKIRVASFLCNMLDKTDKSTAILICFLDFAQTCGIDILKDYISNYVAEDFVHTHSFINLQLAVDYNLMEFKTQIALHLKVDDLSTANKWIILATSPESKDFVLRSLFRLDDKQRL